MPWEKRASRRLVFDGSEPAPLLLVSLKDRELRGTVVNLSEGGMRVRLDGAAPEGMVAGAEVPSCACQLGQAEFPVGLLRVAERCAGPSGQELRLVAQDALGRSRLWLLMARAEQGLEAAPVLPVTEGSDPAGLRIPARGTYSEPARLERLVWIRQVTGCALGHFQETRLPASRLSGNIENYVGGIEVPVGLAGPLLLRGRHARGVVFAPLATTEGALVASASRGALALTRSGGVVTRVLARRMTRVPFFVLTEPDGVALFAQWVRDHQPALRERASEVSRHAVLLSATPLVLGNIVEVFFAFETGDAAGQNMVTACTWHACQWVLEEMRRLEPIRVTFFGIEGNLSGDKKANYRAFFDGRGARVLAECFLPPQVLREVLKVTPKDLVEGHQRTVTGSLHAGSIGHNINVANALAAIFTATGQDIACVHESAVAHFDLQLVDEGVQASLLLPSLIVGTVGGGTHLPQQTDCLELLGCAGAGKVNRLAEIIAALCLGLDLSTLCAGVSGQLAAAHERLGRSRPVRWFSRAELVPGFFLPGLRRVLADAQADLVAVDALGAEAGESAILGELSARAAQRDLGHFPYRLRYRSQGREGTADVMVKIKPLDDEVILVGTRMAGMCSARLAGAYARFRRYLGSTLCHLRELAIYRLTDPRFTEHMPVLYEAFEDPSREAYVLVLELLENVALMDSADDPAGWGQREIEAALRGAASLHAVWYGREPELLQQPWLGPVQSAERMAEMNPLWEALALHAFEELPELCSAEDLETRRRLIADIPQWWGRLCREHPRTLVHNDFNPRNICLRRTDAGLRLCAYDWELATLHLPQHDLAELLCYVLPPDVSRERVSLLVDFHRRQLGREVHREISPEQWREGYRYALADFAVNRLGIYLLIHTFRHYHFMSRLMATTRHLLALEGIGG